MATTYTLRFKRFKLTDHNGMTDVIRRVDWGLTAVADDLTEAHASGTVTLDYPTIGNFIPRASVTPANVQTWFSALSDDEGNNLLTDLKANLDAKIATIQANAVRNDDPAQAFKDGVSV